MEVKETKGDSVTTATEPDYLFDGKQTRPTLDESCIGTHVRIAAWGGPVREIDVGAVGEIVKVNAKTFTIRLVRHPFTDDEVLRAAPGQCIVVGDPLTGAQLSNLLSGEVVEV